MMQTEDIRIGPNGLGGFLTVPEKARGLIIFAHGSGSSRHSPRNAYAARSFEQLGFATLLFDLLTEDEARDRRNVFDIALLAKRVLLAVDWTRQQTSCRTCLSVFSARVRAEAQPWQLRPPHHISGPLCPVVAGLTWPVLPFRTCTCQAF
jgi:putative phosphoribosyl transferase